MNLYTVTLVKNDKLVAKGTAAECFKQMGMERVDKFYDFVGDVRHGRTERYRVETSLLRDSHLSRWYTVYRAKNDEVLATGTSFDCTEQLRLKNVESFYSLVCNSLRGVNKKYVVVVNSSTDEDDDF